jgi:formate dehydrogenase iron-sulfur subunit
MDVENKEQVSILTDLTKCIGCEACVWACKEINDLPRGEKAKTLDAYTWTVIERHGPVNVRRQCMHCIDPACASACPVGAIERQPDGAVWYHVDRCFGCRYCLIACPFQIPKYQWDKATPLMQKCILCFRKRLEQGKQPACTEACPTGATIFGEREELLNIASRRILDNPGRYVNHIFGQYEAGGTSVLYLSHVPFEQLGFKVDVQHNPYPKLTWEVLEKLPTVVTTGGVLLAGIWWITKRRKDVAHEEGEQHKQSDKDRRHE